MPATGTKVDRIEVDRLKNATLPALTCDNRSVSEPSWLAGNSLMSSLPPVASRMRFSASAARMLTGWVGSWPVASLYSNSAPRAPWVRMPHKGTAAAPARSRRRLSGAEADRPEADWPEADRPSAIVFSLFQHCSAARHGPHRLLAHGATKQDMRDVSARLPTAPLLRLPGLDAADHGLGRDAVAFVQGRQRAGVEELVGQGDLAEGRGGDAGAQQQPGNGLAQAAEHGVVLG